MRSRIVLAAILMSMAATPLIAATPIQVAEADALAVEGHTVLAVLDGHATAPTKNAVTDVSTNLLPILTPPTDVGPAGVRWINDQLLAPGLRGLAIAVLVRDGDRSPCTGAILATNPGDSGAQAAFDTMSAVYVRSYSVRDPNNAGWTIDQWRFRTTDGRTAPVWTESVFGNLAGTSTPDDGASRCTPIADGTSASPMGDNGMTFPDGRAHVVAGSLHYDALFVLPLFDLTMAGADKDHAPSARGGDASACESCPGGDRTAQGNSHAFDLWARLGLTPHSDGGTGASMSSWSHATRSVHLAYGTTQNPLVRNFAYVGTEGITNPYPS